uniref:Uncharacterized protein n=1 Tax=Batrachochytrium dendrobatidis (strain JAM81 / FGSC 10211) TaxID=684364 RepID=F4PFE4_BATDJ|eukprot:XP_006683327.1 hypothetical protein BATDEDRAFT_93091 [Batrachochytrium dendrobatidis JAM81]
MFVLSTGPGIKNPPGPITGGGIVAANSLRVFRLTSRMVPFHQSDAIDFPLLVIKDSALYYVIPK